MFRHRDWLSDRFGEENHGADYFKHPFKKPSLSCKKRSQQSRFSNTYSYIKISRRLKLNVNWFKKKTKKTTTNNNQMATSGKPDCCPTTLNPATNRWTEYSGTPKEPQNIYLYIFYSHFIYGLIFTRHNLKTERVDGASVTSPGHPPCPLHHRPSSRSTDPFNMLQQPATKTQSRPLQLLHVNSVGC